MSLKSFIGDPTPIDWLITIGYLAGAGLCWAAARRSAGPPPCPANSVWFWRILAMVLLLLGFNKQLDLQDWLPYFGRQLAQAQGWYSYRRLVQAVLMLLLTAGATVGMVLFYRKNRTAFRAHWGASVGLVVLLGFVLLRAFTFHHVLESPSNEAASTYLNHALELSALVLIGCSASRRKMVC